MKHSKLPLKPFRRGEKFGLHLDQYGTPVPQTGVPELSAKWVRLAPNVKNTGLNKSWIQDLISPGFVPLFVCLTYNRPKSTFCGARYDQMIFREFV